MKRFIMTAYLVIFSTFLLLAIIIEYNGAKYLNIWNPMTKLKHQIAAGEIPIAPFDVIALGNSQLLSGFVPLHFDQAYNLAVPGTVIIDQYYLLEKYLQHHPPPKVLIHGLFPQNEYYHHYTFWNFQVRYGAYSFYQAMDLLYHSVKTNNFFTSKYKEGTVKEITKFILRFISFKLNLPNENQDILQKTFTNAPSQIDFHQVMNESHLQQGYYHFKTGAFLENYFLENLLKTQMEKNDIYQMDPLLKIYLDKMIVLTKKYNIHYVLLHMPNRSQIVDSTGHNTIKGAKDFLINYLRNHPHTTYLQENLSLADSFYSDIFHYTPEGANLLTQKIKHMLLEKKLIQGPATSIVEGDQKK